MFIQDSFRTFESNNIYNNFICKEHRKKGAAREELNPHRRQPPKKVITKVSCACQLKTYTNFQVKPVILLRNLCSVQIIKHHYI